MTIVDAVSCLHENNIVVGDMNTDNIMFGEDGKILLLGLLLSNNDHMQKFSGYCAPEVLKDEKLQSTKENDIFALGCILYEMCTQKIAFNFRGTSGKGIDFNKALSNLHDCIYDYNNLVHIPHFIRRLIDDMLEVDPKNRPSASDISTMLSKYILRRKGNISENIRNEFHQK